MKFSNYLMLVVFGVFLTFFVSACDGDVLNINPEDVITPAIFPENEDDLDLLLNGVYSTLRETSIYNQGLFGFGILDGATPNAFNWGNTTIAKAGDGSLSSRSEERRVGKECRCR